MKLSAKQQQLARYVVVGGSVYLFELAVIIIAQQLGARPVLAVGISFWAGLVVSFIIHKFITFRDHRTQRRIVARQVLAYSLLVLFNFGFTLLCVQLLQSLAPTGIIRALALGITVIWNYYLYQTNIFKQPTAAAV